MIDLYCPLCGGRDLRRGIVTVAHDLRDAEARAIWTTVDGGKVTSTLTEAAPISPAYTATNPGGVVILFSCAGCGPGLTIALEDRTDQPLRFEWVWEGVPLDTLAEAT